MNSKKEVNPFAAHTIRIKAYHAGFQSAFGSQMGYAFLAGLELNAIKEALPHGGFLKWGRAHLSEIPHRSATRYMEFQTKLATGGQCDAVANIKRLENGELPEAEKEKVLKAVYQAADGKTLTQLYRDLGIVRPPIPPGTNNKPRSKGDTDKTAGDHSNEIELLRTFHLDANMFGDETDLTLGLSPSPLLFSLQNSLRVLQHKLDDILKARARDAKSKP